MQSMQLSEGAQLQGGKYSIIRTLGQGGFGITYEAEQVALHRRVAIKEFFMKEYCDRDSTTSHVTLGISEGNKGLVEQFRETIPRDMIKHQVRPGMTGWAQINGLRGDTSIEKRIEHDLYYIENWTYEFDIKILILTIFRGFINKNAY